LQTQKPKIIVAPLNWGIGHATRCVPVINDLIKKGFEPIICSDGNALQYLKKEFATIKTYTLPSYAIKYAKKGYLLKLKLLFQVPKIKKVIKAEHKVIQQIIKKENIKGIISDNRFGVYSTKIPSVYITHQLNVFSGITTFLTSKIHQRIMDNFKEIWIPDSKKQNLSGDLSKSDNKQGKTKFIGVLSRFQNSVVQTIKFEQELLVLLSGTEPQRTILEHKLRLELNNYTKKVLFVRGKINTKSQLKNTDNITFVNFLEQEDLFKSIVNSKFVIARSGYSTIMDLAVLQKKCFFIPTPGQTEQEYLAKNLEQLKISPFSTQNKFKIALLDTMVNYTGFNTDILNVNLDFSIFE